ncbi:MAG TPA: PorP/SprF family type IX secretion system membrane protein [Saprospiraceae bacterium]|nr:PorP/SprF family type IX secretion system membrane protein [Saprospiraceae bacterium]
MRNFLLLSCIIFCFIFPGAVRSQDKLLTQAFAHPVDLNPAFSGVVDGRYRVSLAYRDQWRSIVESAFTTMAIYGDFKIIPDQQKDDFFGAGFSLLTDRTGIFNVNQTMISLYGSYHKALNPDLGKYISAGMNIGISQRNINYENIFFNDQFNGLDNYSLATAEDLPANNFGVFDMGLGVMYISEIGEYSNMAVGLSMDHVPGNSISFYRHTIEPDELLPDSKIYRKLTAFASFELASNEFVSILPRLLWQKQGPHQMFSAATLVKFDITNYDNQAFHFGAGIRLNQTINDGIKPSAGYLLAAYEVQGLLIGLSHDIMLSSLSADDPGKGAFELSISFTGFYDNEESLCPTF